MQLSTVWQECRATRLWLQISARRSRCRGVSKVCSVLRACELSKSHHVICTGPLIPPAWLYRLQEALGDYGRAIQLDSGATLSLHSRALLLERLGQLPAALADYNRYDHGLSEHESGDVPATSICRGFMGMRGTHVHAQCLQNMHRSPLLSAHKNVPGRLQGCSLPVVL